MPAIRHQISIAASPRAVWRALTTGDGLAGWWVDEARVEPRAGGRVVLSNVGDDGEMGEERGFIHTWRPTSHLEIAFDRMGERPMRGSHVSFKLARDGEETRLTLVHSGGEVLEDAEARDALEKDWKSALRALQGMLDES